MSHSGEGKGGTSGGIKEMQMVLSPGPIQVPTQALGRPLPPPPLPVALKCQMQQFAAERVRGGNGLPF